MLFAAANVQAIPPDYDITYLGTLGGNRSFAYGINDLGQVVGESKTGEGYGYETHAFLYTNGIMRDLGALGAGTLGEWGCAYDINNNGWIVGGSTYDSEYEDAKHACLWKPNGTITDLGTLGGEQSMAHKINNNGQIVGYSFIENWDWDRGGFLYSDGVMVNIGTLEGRSTIANSINDLGQIIGESYTSNSYNAFLWDNGIMSNLGFYDEYGSSALDINNNGQIVGSVTFRRSGGGIVSQAILWEEGNMINLGYLENPESFATAINDLGQIVGFSRVVRGNSSHFHACIWDVDGQIYDLNNFFPSGYRTHAYDINNNGQIVGYAELPGGTDYRGFIMTPIPEPTTLLLFLTGGLFMRKIS